MALLTILLRLLLGCNPAMPASTETLPSLTFVSFNPEIASASVVMRRAEQIAFFMEHEVASFYENPPSEGGLGLKYIDEEPYTINDRAGLLLESGPVQEATREYIFGYVPDGDGNFPAEVTALQALVILRKPDGLCEPTGHKPTEITEFDLARRYRGSKWAPLLMRKVVQSIGHNEPVLLDVAVPNVHAQRFYRTNSFRIDRSVPSQRHGVYDVEHQRMISTTETIARALPSPDDWGDR